MMAESVYSKSRVWTVRVGDRTMPALWEQGSLRIGGASIVRSLVSVEGLLSNVEKCTMVGVEAAEDVVLDIRGDKR